MKFHFIVWIDKIKTSVQHLQLLFLHKSLKQFNAAFRGFDAHQLVDYVLRFFSPFQYGLVNLSRQDMVERQVAKPFAVADLLMSAKGHLPRGK